MKYIRITVIRPKMGEEAHVAKLLEEIGTFLASQPGYLEGYEFAAPGHGVGRIGVWSSKEAADHAAQHTHVLALRARQEGLVESHQEILAPITKEHRPSTS